MWWNHMDGSDWWWMTLMMVLLWGLLIWLVVWMVRSSSQTHGDQRSDPEQLLAERFARGEIDETEYRRCLETLRERPPMSHAGRS